jgi:membrane associated rhomboid family serine protease
MRAYLITSGSIFTLVAAMHLFITFEHLRLAQPDRWFILAPVIICVGATSLAAWAFRLLRTAGT